MKSKLTKKITLVHGDDWSGIYIDDVCVHQNHSLSAEEILRILKKEKILNFEQIEPDNDWLYDVGHLPENLSDVKRSSNE